MVAMIDFLLAWLFLAGILFKPSICQPNDTKCLKYLDEVREILTYKIPPINASRMTDNYYNISRALFPSVDLPALYVRVTIQFLKDYQNGTKMIDDQKKNLKFTWSKACSYVSVKHLSLYAMSVFSLCTIYPQRRESQLVMTVPPFCPSSPYAADDETKRNTWRYVVSTLEDIIISPKVSDPRLNTVGCVITGHEGEIDEYPHLWYFCWFILVSSFCSSFSLWVFLVQCFSDGMKNDDTAKNGSPTRWLSGAALTMTCPITVIMFLAGASFVPTLIHLKSTAKTYLYFGVYIGFCVLSLFLGCIGNYLSVKGQTKYLLGSYCLFPCLFQTIHHFLWMVCGIISEPFWAIPIFLLECLFALSILFALFLYEKEFVGKEPDSFINDQTLHGNGLIKIHLVLCWGSFTLVLITVALIAVNNGNAVNSPTAGVLEGTMAMILLWLIKNLDFWKKDKVEDHQATEGEPSGGGEDNGSAKPIIKSGRTEGKKHNNTRV